MLSLINKLTVKDTVMLKADVWYKKGVFLKCEDNSSFIKDLIKMLSL